MYIKDIGNLQKENLEFLDVGLTHIMLIHVINCISDMLGLNASVLYYNTNYLYITQTKLLFLQMVINLLLTSKGLFLVIIFGKTEIMVPSGGYNTFISLASDIGPHPARF